MMLVIPEIEIQQGSLVLVLEDDPAREKFFRSALRNIDVTFVSTVEDAIDKLKEVEFDWVFLDHDLDGQQMVESGPGTGYSVAVWLARNRKRQPENIVVHSLNNTSTCRRHRTAFED